MGWDHLQALNKRNVGRNLLSIKDLGASPRPPKWEFLPNPGVTKPAADRFPFGLVLGCDPDSSESHQTTK